MKTNNYAYPISLTGNLQPTRYSVQDLNIRLLELVKSMRSSTPIYFSGELEKVEHGYLVTLDQGQGPTILISVEDVNTANRTFTSLRWSEIATIDLPIAISRLMSVIFKQISDIVKPERTKDLVQTEPF